MISTSWGFRRQVSQNTNCQIKALLTLADGGKVQLSGSDISMSSCTFSQGTSSSGSFDIGAAIIGSFTCTLDNFDRRFDDADFADAKVTVQLGLEVDGEMEWITKGTYWIEEAPASYGTTLGLSFLDSMMLFDRKPFSSVGADFPITAANLARDICAACGVPLLTMGFAGSGATLYEPADAAGMSCRDALSYLAQATGNYARITNDDRLEIAWYDLSAFEGEDWLDGEDFDDATPYASGSTADGGSFNDYSDGDDAEGGSFNSDRIANVISFSAATVAVDDVVITGIRVTAEDERATDGTPGRKGETALIGREGYVLDISGNPFITCGHAREAAQRIYNAVGGMVFRPFDVSALGDPSYEAGDPIVITDYNQRTYRSYITSATYRMGSYEALSCNAESISRRASASAGAMTRALQAAREEVRAEKTAREAAVERLNNDLENAPGIYTTTKVENGASTWYIHDKAELRQSQFVWKVNSAGFGMSIDGGKTYAYGLDKWGNAILNNLYAIGINADYITAGSIRVRSGGTTIFCADVNAGQFWWSTANTSLGTNGYLTVTGGKIGGFAITSNAITSGGMSLKADGLGFRTAGTAVGFIGANSITGNAKLRGLDFDLEYSGAYMSWAWAQTPSASSYAHKLCYAARKFGSYASDSLNAGCDLDMHGFRLRNAVLDEGSTGYGGAVTGTLSFVYANGYKSGTTTRTLQLYRASIKLKRGVVMGWSFDKYN